MVDRILRCLQDVSGQKQIFLCGHSLGGGLVTMLSLILPTRCALFISEKCLDECIERPSHAAAMGAQSGCEPHVLS